MMKQDEHMDRFEAGCHLIRGQSVMARLICQHDWSTSPLGPIATWSPALLTAVNVVLASPVHMQLLWGPELVVLYNDPFMVQLGSKHPNSLGMAARDCWKEVWPLVEETLQRCLRDGAVTDQKAALIPIDRDGRIEDSYWDYSYSPVYEESGAIGGVFNISHEVTKEVFAKRKLQASEEQAVRVLSSIGDAVIVTDAEGRVVRMNPVAEQLTGWSCEEAYGVLLKTLFPIFNEATGDPVENPVDKVKRLGTVVALANHTILARRDGIEVHIDDSGAPIVNEEGVLTGVVLVFRDVGERRALERERRTAAEKVRLERERLLAVLQQAPAFFALLEGPEHVITMVNSLYLNLINHKDVLGKPVREALPEAVEQGYVEVLDGILKTGQPVSGSNARFEVYGRAGEPAEERFVDFVYQPLLEINGEVSGVILLGVDITDRKKAQETLMRTEKLSAVGRLASSIAHEINNPLESVTNLLFLARQGEASPEVMEYLETADRELRRVSVITSQTLRFHRQSSSPTEVSATSLIDSVLSIYQGKIVNSKVVVVTEERSDAVVLCFAGEIRQVLSNLVGNSIDAMPEGGRLILRSREATLWKTGRRGLEITVADTGSGMSPHTIARAFEPFYTTKGIGGSGLGLWISKEILDRHEGNLKIRSSQRAGHTGTVITLSLPFEAASR